MTDLHTQLRAAIEQRLATAKRVHDAEPGTWRVGPGPSSRPHSRFWPDGDWLAEVGTAEDAEFIAANSPDVIIRQCEADLRRLERHAPCPRWCDIHGPHPDNWCHACDCGVNGCRELADVYASYALDIPGSPNE